MPFERERQRETDCDCDCRRSSQVERQKEGKERAVMAGSTASFEGIDIWGSRKTSLGGSRNRSYSIGSEVFFSRNNNGVTVGTPSRQHGMMHHLSHDVEDDEEALKWAALEKLPTYDRLRTTILQKHLGSRVVHEEVDVRTIGFEQRQQIIDSLLKVADEDNEKFLLKLRNRIDR